MKNIYIEPDEEIISVIDRLVQIEDEQVNLVVPKGAQIWQSSINLKLLKREVDNLKKEITLIVSNDLGAEMAEKIGFLVKKEKEFPTELIQEEKEDWLETDKPKGDKKKIKKDREDMIGRLVKELKSEKRSANPFSFFSQKIKSTKKDFSSKETEVVSKKKGIFGLASLSSKKPRRKMADIIYPEDKAEADFFRRQPPREKPATKTRPRPAATELEKMEPVIKEETPLIIEPSIISRVASKWSWSKFLVIFIIIAFLIAGFVSYLVLPTTEVILSPKIESISFDLSVIGTKEISQIDESLNKIPLQEIEVAKTRSREFLATGEKQLNEKARGFITIYNEYSSSPQSLVATTRFESPEGKIFRITKTLTVPGAKIEEGKIVPSSIEAEVVADEPGADYNISPTNFTIPGFKGTAKYAGFYGRSKTAITGGSTEKVKIVLSEDLQNGEDSLVEELKNQVNQVIEQQIPTGLKIIEGGLKENLTKISSSAEEGDQADKFTIEIRLTVKALLYKEEDLKNLVDLNAISIVSENKRSLSETQQIEWAELIIDWEKGEASFSLHIKEDVASQIDIDTLKKDLAGQSEVEVRKYLASRTDIERAKVTFWPFWVKRIPAQQEKIKITID